MKIHNKIIALLIVVFVIYTLLFSIFIYYSIYNYAFADFYKRLEIRAAITAKIKLEEHSETTSIHEVDQEYLEVLPNQSEYIIPIKNGVADIDSLDENVPENLVQHALETGSANYNKSSFFYSAILYENENGESYVVIVSAENYFYTHHIKYLRNLLLVCVLFGLLWIVFFSVLISRSLIRPINSVVDEVRSIGSENLHLRLKFPDNHDALAELRITFNDMLNRLETSFETQKNFISNASHELNTPLTSIIGEADLALSKERTTEEYKTALAKISEEAEKLDKKTKALLFLAQTGYNGKAQKFDKIRVDQLILDVKETLQKISTSFKTTLDFSMLPESPEKLKIRGNEQLLHLALSNVLVNACKYSDKQAVSVALAASDKEVIIVVKDKGIGIPESELKYIYDPYFRASNTNNYEGYGIGLPLTRNIIRMHKGSITVSSVLNQGTTVQINLPLGNYTL